MRFRVLAGVRGIIENMKKRGRIKFHRIKTWQLLVILIPLFFIDATLLRISHVHMRELTDKVLEADVAEDDERIYQSLDELKKYVFSNIVVNVVDDNGLQKITFGTGPFALEHQYRRAAQAAIEEAERSLSSDENPNGNIYAKASEVCRPQAIAGGWAWDDQRYINCMMGEIEKYPSMEDLSGELMANVPSPDLYRYNYASPVWAPTVSGFLILITLIIIVVILVRILVWIMLRLALFFV